MIPSSNIIAFVATTKPDQALHFYQEVLGLHLVEDEESAMVFDANGTMLRITKLEKLAPPQYTVLGWIVDDIEAAVRELGGKGVTFERYPGLDQDVSGICTFPNGDRVAWFIDPDGSILSVSQF